MPRFNIHHITKYTYEGPVRDSANQIVLFPVKDEFQEVLKHELTVTGEPVIEVYKDYYGNEVGSFTHAEPHTSLIIDSRIEVVTKQRPALQDSAEKEAQWAMLEQIRWQVPYIDFLKQERFASLSEVLESVCPDKARSQTPLEAALQLRTYVYEHFKYIKGVTSVESTLDEVWKLRAGVCQDFAHMLLVFLRQIQIPARYVSGYICPNQNGMRGEGATHAWIEAYIPFNGWVGLDPTNNCIADDLHVRLAVGRSFSDCSPVKGTYKGTAGQVLEVGVSVSYENGRTTEDVVTVLEQQPSINGSEVNSYRRYMEMMQQQ
ncbi:transglutaminase family protein [Puia dinghuensis]|uniref:Transglutaminase n=1 Tax=Puia dinghuensis TaxID=1792502 RepID=A0A8J2UFU3_9BACT|nr:transglutaminase family protein [Puia dinghuensis]GGB10858.1 transglutaminase [Puia dinghuensis]